MITDFMLVEGVEEKIYSTGRFARENGTEPSGVVSSVEGKLPLSFYIA